MKLSRLTTAPAAKSAGSAAPCEAGNVRSLVPISRTAARGALAAEGVPPLRSRCRRWPDWSAAVRAKRSAVS